MAKLLLGDKIAAKIWDDTRIAVQIYILFHIDVQKSERFFKLLPFQGVLKT